MITEVTGTCDYPDCPAPAETIAATGECADRLGVYCYAHATVIEDERGPEYNVRCPNCDCHFGVN